MKAGETDFLGQLPFPLARRAHTASVHSNAIPLQSGFLHLGEREEVSREGLGIGAFGLFENLLKTTP